MHLKMATAYDKKTSEGRHIKSKGVEMLLVVITWLTGGYLNSYSAMTEMC